MQYYNQSILHAYSKYEIKGGLEDNDGGEGRSKDNGGGGRKREER